jgi:hypothetical protein
LSRRRNKLPDGVTIACKPSPFNSTQQAEYKKNWRNGTLPLLLLLLLRLATGPSKEGKRRGTQEKCPNSKLY